MKDILKRNEALLAQVDAWFVRCIELYPEKIACQSGCSGCCRSSFDITLLDAYYLKLGLDTLPPSVQETVLDKCRERLLLMREKWPEFDHPFVLNYRPEEEWEALMPDEDETPCVLLGDDGRCLVYDNRPMTCRLHGIPLVDTEGEVMHDEWCTINFIDEDPLQLQGIKAPFDRILHEEVALFRDFTGAFLGRRMGELDTLIPTALLIDFDRFDWGAWLEGFAPADNEP